MYVWKVQKKVLNFVRCLLAQKQDVNVCGLDPEKLTKLHHRKIFKENL
jgi:hypothetical protein